MPTKKSEHPDLSLNPNNVKVGDTVVKDNYIGLVTDVVSNNGNKVLQFWVKWAESTSTVPVVEIASSLTPISPINHDLINTKVNGGFVHSFIYHSGEIKAQIIKDSGLPVLFSLDQLNHKLQQSSHPTVNIYTLTIDPNLQQRVKLNQDTVSEYAIALSEGEEFPPITIWRCTDDGQLYLVDGFHRVEGAKLAKIDELPFIEKSGSYREAMLFTISVNSTHGLPRSNADKRKAVMALLQDAEWSKLSTRELAKLAKVSHQLVHKMRIEIADTERRQQNLQDIKNYALDSEASDLSIDTPTVNNYKYPEDAIKFLDDDFDQEGSREWGVGSSEIEETVNNDSQEPLSIAPCPLPFHTTPDVIPLNESQYSLICDRHTIEALEKFMKAEGIESVPKALWKLLNLYRLSQDPP